MKNMKNGIILLAILSLLGLASCGGSATATGTGGQAINQPTNSGNTTTTSEQPAEKPIV
jgi:ABC-type glycerol-3-phosphate transport system substrate-binding protein